VFFCALDAKNQRWLHVNTLKVKLKLKQNLLKLTELIEPLLREGFETKTGSRSETKTEQGYIGPTRNRKREEVIKYISTLVFLFHS